MRTIDKGFYRKINRNIEISETELNELARKQVEETQISEKSKLKKKMFKVEWYFILAGGGGSTIIDITASPQHRIGASGLSPRL